MSQCSREAQDIASAAQQARKGAGLCIDYGAAGAAGGAPGTIFDMSANNFWNITFGAYSLAVRRGDLTYSLTETQTGTVWADALPVGYVEIAERETGAVTRYSFGDLKLVSLSEKAGATGKRILFGLDAPGKIPVDVYLTCSEREIQLTVEASRDTRTHRVERVVLLPGLCAAPDDADSYLVVPHREGAILFADDAPGETASFRVWDADDGLTMPFVGAVRGASALALLTDSAYCVADLSRNETGATLDLRYERDPERRRLDVRVVPLPGGDYVAVARAYRDKVIGDGGHVSFRKKMRERPALAAWLRGNTAAQNVRHVDVPRFVDAPDRWRTLEGFVDEIAANPADEARFGALAGDWTAPLLDAWRYDAPPALGVAVPLLSVVFHDCTALCFDFAAAPTTAAQNRLMLRALLHVAQFDVEQMDEYIATFPMPHLADVLRGVNQKSFAAFVVAHRFLTPDFAVEEAHYSNGMRVVVNGNAAQSYETPDFDLPPQGFYVTHPEASVFCALRIGEQVFEPDSWHVSYTRDDEPLADSADVCSLEYRYQGLKITPPGTTTV